MEQVDSRFEESKFAGLALNISKHPVYLQKRVIMLHREEEVGEYQQEVHPEAKAED